MRRDLAIVINKAVPFKDIQAVVESSAGNELVNARVFDVYTGPGLSDEEKSVALALVWQRVDRTLNDAEINESFEQVITALTKEFDARLRS